MSYEKPLKSYPRTVFVEVENQFCPRGMVTAEISMGLEDRDELLLEALFKAGFTTKQEGLTRDFSQTKVLPICAMLLDLMAKHGYERQSNEKIGENKGMRFMLVKK